MKLRLVIEKILGMQLLFPVQVPSWLETRHLNKKGMTETERVSMCTQENVH